MRKIILFLFICFSVKAVTAQTIKGVVKDEKGNPIPSVSVKVKNSDIGTKTDSLGSFTINSLPNTTLLFTAIGFSSDSIKINRGSLLHIVLKTNVSKLGDVTVTGKPGSPDGKTNQVISNQIVSNTLQDYQSTQNINNGPHLIEASNPKSSIDAVHYISTAPSGTFYNGAAVPTFHHKDDTKGSKYLFDKWVNGKVIMNDGSIYQNNGGGFNYDKMSGSLLLMQNEQTVMDVDRGQFKSFILTDENGNAYTFELVPSIDNQKLVQVLAEAPGKYSLYKKTTTKFEKANYVSTGLTESGHNYDEYTDDFTYFVSFPNGQLKEIGFKKKGIKEVFGGDKRVDVFMNAHKEDTIDELYLEGLVRFLNS